MEQLTYLYVYPSHAKWHIEPPSFPVIHYFLTSLALSCNVQIRPAALLVPSFDEKGGVLGIKLAAQPPSRQIDKLKS